MGGEVFPIGTVLFFVGTFTDNVTMVGWYVCDGTDSTPTITNKFLRGAAASGGTGGTDNIVNISHSHGSISTRAAHNHGGTTGTSNPATHQHTFLPWVYAAGGASGAVISYWGSSGSNWTLYRLEGAHTHSGDMSSAGGHSHTSSSSGAAGAGKNMPEYKRAIPIIRIA